MRRKTYNLNNSLNARISKNIGKLLRKAELSQEKLAIESEIDKSNLSKLLSGKINYTLSTLSKIAECLRVDISKLLEP